MGRGSAIFKNQHLQILPRTSQHRLTNTSRNHCLWTHTVYRPQMQVKVPSNIEEAIWDPDLEMSPSSLPQNSFNSGWDKVENWSVVKKIEDHGPHILWMTIWLVISIQFTSLHLWCYGEGGCITEYESGNSHIWKGTISAESSYQALEQHMLPSRRHFFQARHTFFSKTMLNHTLHLLRQHGFIVKESRTCLPAVQTVLNWKHLAKNVT